MNVAVVGLGYVGLPLAVALARKHDVVGFDISERRVAALREGVDATNEIGADELAAVDLKLTGDPALCAAATSSSSPCRRRSTSQPARFHRRWSACRAGRPGAVDRARSSSSNRRSIPASTEEDLRAGAGEGLGAAGRRRLQARLFAGAHQSGRPEHRAREDHQDRRRARTRETLERVAAALRRDRRRPASTGRRRSRSPKRPRSSRTRSATSTSR